MATATADRNLRQNVRNFLLTATKKEMRQELLISIEREDFKRAMFVAECLAEETSDLRKESLHDFVKEQDVSLVGGKVVTVHCFHTRLFHLTDFVVVEANSRMTTLIPLPGTPDACSECGWVGCQSGCSAYAS